ncbi:TonB-dependent receptor plug domain-containing protein, partial [Pseudoalteromonas lipolytica]
MKNTLLTKQTILTTVILGHLYAVPAIAMDTEDKIEKEENLEVITVTSRKKLETILEIPMSISAVSAVEIANRNYLDASDIYRTLAGAAAPRGQLILRGLSGGNSASPDTTAIFTDDIPYEFTNLTDVERVEVLRGPQGTLYGSNAIGGTVRVITKKPQLDEFELFGTIEGSSENNVDGFDSSLSLGVNVPLLDDTLALRVTGNITNDVRPYVNQATGQQSKSQSSFIRSQLLWQPIDNLALNFTYVHDEYSANGATLGDTSKPGYYYELSYDEDASAKYGYDISDTKIT